ncbi:CHAT domain-containing protein [Streptomyces sp. cg35]|uniref:CHAT domain-containing protein n=1 Tax=Streptomyces sp. cg35 TaxID=3421650 RepID=UPI003D16381D
MSEESAFPAQAVDIDRKPPTGFAVLNVHRHRDHEHRPAFGVSGVCGESTLPFTVTAAQLRPDAIRLGNLRKGGNWPSEIHRIIRTWSRRQDALRGWIDGLRARYGAGLRLVIWDDTDYDIPWELLWLEADAERSLPAGHLGALITVARWTTVREAGVRPMEHGAECSGPVVGYYDPAMRRDADVFQDFAHQHHDALHSLLGELTQQELRAGLVYLACHGQYGTELTDLRLDVASWEEMDELDMTALRSHATLVCLNACHSARSVHNVAQGEDALRGFAELFLRQGASGCIASSGQVGDDIAHAVIRRIVAEIAADPAKPVAQTLRDFRARATAALPTVIPWTSGAGGRPDEQGQHGVLAFLYSFMFLYFGSPLTTLRLTPRGHEEAS